MGDLRNIRHTINGLLEKLTAQAGHPSYDMRKVRDANEDMRSLKTLLMLGVRGTAAYIARSKSCSR